MKKVGFDADKYIEEQSKHILERINENDCERLYLEFGGKLVQDKHAMRVLPGFDENAKIKLLHRLKDKAEIVICIYSGDIVTNKTRQDFGITYDMEVLRIIDMFRRYGLSINSVVVTRYEDEPAVNMFINRLERRGIRTYKHSFTKGYPTDVDTIVSEEGYGANPYIEVTKPIVVVNAPGGGSGKLATCLSQLYHEKQRGVTARYAKFETFPIWNLPLKHPVNIAYEAATADLKDVNMIDSFHLDAYGETAVNYNRDLEIFPVLKRIIEKITGTEAEYRSPTDMGVNRAGFCITDDEVCREAACQEVIRRYLIAECDYKKGKTAAGTVSRTKLLMDELGLVAEDRAVVKRAREYVVEAGLGAVEVEVTPGVQAVHDLPAVVAEAQVLTFYQSHKQYSVTDVFPRGRPQRSKTGKAVQVCLPGLPFLLLHFAQIPLITVSVRSRVNPPLSDTNSASFALVSLPRWNILPQLLQDRCMHPRQEGEPLKR